MRLMQETRYERKGRILSELAVSCLIMPTRKRALSRFDDCLP